MKKLLLGAVAACCSLHVSAAPVDDFIGTWKLERTTVPNYVVIKQEGDQLVALRYTRHVLTNKITAALSRQLWERQRHHRIGRNDHRGTQRE